MTQPSGFISNDQTYFVCLLKKLLYKLKQSPIMWFRHLHNFLASIGFIGSRMDPSLFFFRKENTVYILVYIDDIIVTSSNELFVQQAIEKIGSEFATQKLGSLKYFLGIQAQRYDRGIHLINNNTW